VATTTAVGSMAVGYDPIKQRGRVYFTITPVPTFTTAAAPTAAAEAATPTEAAVATTAAEATTTAAAAAATATLEHSGSMNPNHLDNGALGPIDSAWCNAYRTRTRQMSTS